MKFVTPKLRREMDRRTVETVGLPGHLFMEHAAMGAAHVLLRAIEDAFGPHKPGEGRTRSIGILCGGGRNGGDGLAMARILAQYHFTPVIVLLRAVDLLPPDTALNLHVARNLGFEIHDFSGVTAESIHPRLTQIHAAHTRSGDLVAWCDALVGSGLKENLHGLYAEAVAFLNAEYALDRARIIAVDIPTGLSSKTGQVMGIATRAHITATFSFPQVGHLLYPGRELCGELEVLNIGVPAPVSDAVGYAGTALNAAWAQHRIAPRARDAHKGQSGRLLLLAGSNETTGAALLAAQGALRSGAGLLTVGTHTEVLARIAQAIPDAMATHLLAHVPDDGLQERLLERSEVLDAIGIGPGIGTSDGSLQQLNALLHSEAPYLVIDADALTVLAKFNNYEDLRAFSLPTPDAQPRVVLTPHPSEMARLCRCRLSDILAAPVEKAQQLARETGAIVVLKLASTVVAAPDGELAINLSGSPGMATGGTGDVLTGVLTARLAETHASGAAGRVFDVVCLAVYAHGLAGERAAAQLGERGMSAMDLALQLPRVWNDLE